ncbi:MAG: heavy metal-responsive transcriptional regulator [Actinomycetota bacterium]
MRIGKLAEASGIPTTTIRYYEEIGLMPPPQRTASGYRDYEPNSASRLEFIQAAQSVGLTLGEIREILAFRDQGEFPCRHVAALIDQHAAELSQRIRTLEAMLRDLERLSKKAQSISPKDAKAAAFCHIIEGSGSHSIGAPAG